MRRVRSDSIGAVDVFAVLLVISVLTIAGLAYVVATLPGPPESNREILYLQEGDIASYDFVAHLETGEVFATSLASVGGNDAVYPKALSFRPPDAYQPYNMSVGAGMFGDGFDGLLDEGRGLQERLMGMAVGETRTVTLQAAEAFGHRDPALVETRSLVETLPMLETVNFAEYTSRFLQQPLEDQTVLDPFWGWPVRILSFDQGSKMVTFRIEPTLGQVVSPYATFDSRVVRVDASDNGGEGVVEVRHLLTEEDAGRTIAEGLKGGFLVRQVDLAGGTFQADFNDLRRDHTVTYVITLLEIGRP